MISSREVIKILKQAGWAEIATRGDHVQFKHDKRPGRVTVPHPVKDLGITLIKSIEKQSGIRLR